LQQAHEFLRRGWPGRDTSASAWLAHHQRAAELYAHVAEVNPAHHHEALHWAGQEQESVRALAEQVKTAGSRSSGDQET
jgi:hypothetical protein